MKVKAIKDCPNNLPGDVFELPEDLGKVFVGLGLAQEVTSTPTPPKSNTPKPKAPGGRTYQRRDLEAEK